jgi:hypothetical protein
MSSSITRRASVVAVAAATLTAQPQPASAAPNDAVLSNYLQAWRQLDIEAILVCAHADIHFKAPNAETNGAQAYRQSTARFLSILERVETRASFIDGEQAMIAWDFTCRGPIGACPTAELVRFDAGLVRSSEIYFDVRPFEAYARAQRGQPSP